MCCQQYLEKTLGNGYDITLTMDHVKIQQSDPFSSQVKSRCFLMITSPRKLYENYTSSEIYRGFHKVFFWRVR